MAYGEPLLSKVIENNDVGALTRYGVEAEHFPTEAERQAYRFIVEYAAQNRGQAPDYRTVTAEIDGFTYMPGVTDTYEYLTAQLKSQAAKIRIHGLITEKAVEKYAQMDGHAFIEWLQTEMENIKMRTSVREKVGVDAKRDTDRFVTEYTRRKIGKSFKIWQSKFPTINEEIGGYFSGNIYTWYGRSGRGKSVITLEECIEAAMQGARVLIWAMEMSEYEVLARLYTSVSGREGLLKQEVDGIAYDAGFENRQFLTASMDEDTEEAMRTFLRIIHEHVQGEIIVRAADHEDFARRDVRQLEADIVETDADVVLIDPFYYMHYERNTSKTAGGDASNTSMRLRALAGRMQAVIHVITQADEDDRGKADGERMLKVPARSEIKKTKQVLEDAANVFGIDSVNADGVAAIKIGKGRSGGEGTEVELLYLPGIGIVREMDTGAAIANQFDDDVTNVF